MAEEYKVAYYAGRKFPDEYAIVRGCVKLHERKHWVDCAPEVVGTLMAHYSVLLQQYNMLVRELSDYSPEMEKAINQSFTVEADLDRRMRDA